MLHDLAINLQILYFVIVHVCIHGYFLQQHQGFCSKVPNICIIFAKCHFWSLCTKMATVAVAKLAVTLLCHVQLLFQLLPSRQGHVQQVSNSYIVTVQCTQLGGCVFFLQSFGDEVQTLDPHCCILILR